MSVYALDNLTQTDSVVGKITQPNAEAMRRTARQFEAILLMQLTSAINATSDEDDGEEKLFGSDGGTGLAKKMFSEQLATTMSESGGVGLADMIMQKFGGQTKPADKSKSFSNAISAVRDIKQTVAAPKNSITTEQAALSADNGAKNFLTPDGKILNSTRPRIVPASAIKRNGSAFSTDNFPVSLNASERGSFQMPVNGRISSDFGTRFHPIDRKMKFHGGIDIAVPKGTPIGAAADGIVKFAGWKGGYGNVVIIQHRDGSETVYGHNDKLLVVEGQQVAAGEVISLSGSTGKSTGPHLHFEVRVNGEAVNPRNFFSNVLPDSRR